MSQVDDTKLRAGQPAPNKTNIQEFLGESSVTYKRIAQMLNISMKDVYAMEEVFFQTLLMTGTHPVHRFSEDQYLMKGMLRLGPPYARAHQQAKVWQIAKTDANAPYFNVAQLILTDAFPEYFKPPAGNEYFTLSLEHDPVEVYRLVTPMEVRWKIRDGLITKCIGTMKEDTRYRTVDGIAARMRTKRARDYTPSRTGLSAGARKQSALPAMRLDKIRLRIVHPAFSGDTNNAMIKNEFLSFPDLVGEEVKADMKSKKTKPDVGPFDLEIDIIHEIIASSKHKYGQGWLAYRGTDNIASPWAITENLHLGTAVSEMFDAARATRKATGEDENTVIFKLFWTRGDVSTKSWTD